MRKGVTCPGGVSGRSVLSCPRAVAFPVTVAGRLPHQHFRGLLRVHFSLRPARSLTLLKGPFAKCFSAFVASCTAPSGSGGSWVAGRDFHPQGKCALARRTQ